MDKDCELKEENSGVLHLYYLPENPKYRQLVVYKKILDKLADEVKQTPKQEQEE